MLRFLAENSDSPHAQLPTTPENPVARQNREQPSEAPKAAEARGRSHSPSTRNTISNLPSKPVALPASVSVDIRREAAANDEVLVSSLISGGSRTTRYWPRKKRVSRKKETRPRKPWKNVPAQGSYMKRWERNFHREKWGDESEERSPITGRGGRGGGYLSFPLPETWNPHKTNQTMSTTEKGNGRIGL